MTKKRLAELARQELARRELARRKLEYFVKYIFPGYSLTNFHKNYIKLINMFAHGQIKKLIVSMPSQHGKSEISTRLLVPYLFGINPDLQIAIGSYNQTFARKFSRQIKRYMSDAYNKVFENVKLPGKMSNYSDTMDEWELEKSKGNFKAVGRGGGITGEPVDIMIMDDLYKDYAEATSPVIRENVIDWYKGSVRTRLHNDSRQLIVFTRWHEEDLIGYLQENEKVVEIKSFSDIKKNQKCWYKINFQAIKENEKTKIDPREKNEPLWPERHSYEKLLEDKALDPEKFESLSQGNPRPMQGLLYTNFATYDVLPPDAKVIKFYVDTADTGSDFLYSIIYSTSGEFIYVRDVYGSDEPAEITEREVALQFLRRKVNFGHVESNNGGRGWARAVERILRDEFKYRSFNLEWFHQSENKEARIISNAGNLQKYILFPSDWKTRWPVFSGHITGFRKNFKANTHDDACFIAGTLIQTLFGKKPIEKITNKDYVLTPYGFKKVLKFGCTGEKVVIKKIGLTGTKNHKIFTNNGFIELDRLTGVHQYDKINKKGFLLWMYKKLFISMESNITLWDRESITLVHSIKIENMPKDFMQRFGNFIIKKKFLKAIVFIIKTVILLTMTSIIWNWLKLVNTFQCIQKKIIKKIKKSNLDIFIQCKKKQKNGIKVKRVENGIQDTVKRYFQKENQLKKNVNIVTKNMKRCNFGVNFVLINAVIIIKEKILCGLILKLFVKFVENNLKENIIGNQKKCQEHAQQVVNQKLDMQLVYNLKVKDVGVYYANNILVSNCDCLTGVYEKSQAGTLKIRSV